MAVLSERGEPPWWSKIRVPRKRSLNTDRIVGAAMTVLDRDGLEGLSLRRLGAELGSGASSVYWYVPSKEALLDLLVDRLMGEAADETRHDPNASWRAQLAAHALALRTVLLRHIGGATLLAARMPVGPNGLRFMERLLSALADAGFGGQQRALACAALTGYTIGQVVLESRTGPTTPKGRPTEGEQLQRLGGLLRGAPRDRYPNVVGSAADLTELTDEEAFNYGLQRMLDGLEAELGRVNPLRRAF